MLWGENTDVNAIATLRVLLTTLGHLEAEIGKLVAERIEMARNKLLPPIG
jgi:hypothetical protein